MKHIITIIISTCFLFACNGKVQTNKNKAKDIPLVNKMLEAYHKQEHRIAFSGCEMTYNEKPFKLGMSVDELIQIFGQYDRFFRGFFIWEKVGIVSSINIDRLDEKLDLNKKSTYLYVYMNTGVDDSYKEKFKHELNHKNDYFLLEGMPIDKNMRVMDFIANSQFSLNDFAVSNDGYELDYKCNDKKVGYYLEADGLWLRKGSGHLTYKDKPNPENKNTFEMLYITEIEE